MVLVKKHDRTKLYEKMIETEKEAYNCQDLLLNEITKYLEGILDQEAADHTKIILGQGGYIQIRTVETLSTEDIEDFKNEFNFDQTWFRDEYMTDYRNIETVSVHIYEYGFIPKNINEIMGDNQVKLQNINEIIGDN